MICPVISRHMVPSSGDAFAVSISSHSELNRNDTTNPRFVELSMPAGSSSGDRTFDNRDHWTQPEGLCHCRNADPSESAQHSTSTRRDRPTSRAALMTAGASASASVVRCGRDGPLAASRALKQPLSPPRRKRRTSVSRFRVLLSYRLGLRPSLTSVPISPVAALQAGTPARCLSESRLVHQQAGEKQATCMAETVTVREVTSN
jgi:hypothetical protein